MRKSSKRWRMPEDSLSKLVVWFKNGTARTFYSFDWNTPNSYYRDRSLGLARLYKFAKKIGNDAGVAQIYDIQTDQLIQNFYEGVPTRKKS